jgi:hypothetical protein
MTRLHIVEEIVYIVDMPEATPYDTMRAFLDDPHRFVNDVREREVTIMEPTLSFDDEVAANEAISQAELDA